MGNALMLVALSLAVLAAPPTITEAELTPDTFDRWHAYLRPTDDELRWQDIPWRASLWQAVLDAQRERKPILLWAMNGHPMGCT